MPKTRPVTPADCVLPSQTTSGEIESGPRASFCSSVRPLIMPRSSVMRVSAVGAIALTVTP